MIEVLDDMPDGVSGFRVSGRVSGDELRDFRSTLEPLLDTGEVRLVEVVSDDYEGFGPGGLLEDIKIGFGTLIERHSAFRRIAVVSDKDWIVHALHALAWMVPADVALFRLDQLDKAKAWAAG
jgi:hypothetical protein